MANDSTTAKDNTVTTEDEQIRGEENDRVTIIEKIEQKKERNFEKSGILEKMAAKNTEEKSSHSSLASQCSSSGGPTRIDLAPTTPGRSGSDASRKVSGSIGMRKLQIVVVIDQKVSRHLKARETVWNELQKIAEHLNVTMTKIYFDRLDYGETSTLDTFYNADIALVDISILHQRTSLCYHVGVRESMGQMYNILLCHWNQDFVDQQTSAFIDALLRALIL